MIREAKIIKYEKPSGGITKLHIFLANAYVFKTVIKGSSFVCETEEDVYECINHFKFLRKYNLV